MHNNYKIIYYRKSKTWQQYLMHHFKLLICTPKMHFYCKCRVFEVLGLTGQKSTGGVS